MENLMFWQPPQSLKVLDVPNANTIFINNANNFGLSDLHQMRGRVGRSNKKSILLFHLSALFCHDRGCQKTYSSLEQFSELEADLISR
jgi:transcription-repair coupling factor (superfamily II helicase)